MKGRTPSKWALVIATSLFLVSFLLVLGPVNKVSAAPYGLSWYTSGNPGLPYCIQIQEPSEPPGEGWGDNYLCAPSNLGYQWQYVAPNCADFSLPTTLYLNEPSDPDFWSDNVLCLPSSMNLTWYNNGRPNGPDCIQINEPSDPQGWNNNWLCDSTPPTPPPPPPSPPPPTSISGAKPYFNTLNGGPFVGGWFNSGTGTCDGPNYQRPTFGASLGNKYAGAIMGWANSNRGNSARSTLDAFATGLIEGNGSTDYGFYTGLSGTGALSFANVNSFSTSDFWGGIFEGAVLTNAHCIPDYYTTKDTNVVGGWTTGNYSQSGQRTWPGGNMPGGIIPAGNTLILFVNGDVNITNNITYASSDITNVPKFALIVQGDIRIAPNVTQLEGWYIAQPNGATGGVIWTCNNGTSTISDTFIRNNCGSKLTINGALTARQVNLSRIAGDLGGGSAEDINFSPEMVLGGSFFEDVPGSSTSGTIQSLISLPPVF